MKHLLRTLKQWTLLIAIVVGALGHSFFSQFTPITPWLLAAMLLLTFCNISPRDLRFHPLLLILLGIQVAMSLILYAVSLPWHPAIAQGVCMAALTPTATAAAIITGMLGGSVAFLAAYVFLSSIAIVVLAPVVLPIIATGPVDAWGPPCSCRCSSPGSSSIPPRSSTPCSSAGASCPITSGL